MRNTLKCYRKTLWMKKYLSKKSSKCQMSKLAKMMCILLESLNCDFEVLFVSLLFGFIINFEICPHNSVCFPHNWCIFLPKIPTCVIFFPHPVTWLVACHEIHHYYNIFSDRKEDGQTSRGVGYAGSRFILRRLHTVQILIFWLADLYHVILGCDETTMRSLLWCNTSRSLHHDFS